MTARVTSIMNLKGGVGKSTVAMIVAEYLAFKFGKRVLVIDFDSQANLTSAMIKPLYSHNDLPKQGRTTYHLFVNFLNGAAKAVNELICPYTDGVSNIQRRPGITLDMVASSPDLARLEKTYWTCGKLTKQSHQVLGLLSERHWNPSARTTMQSLSTAHPDFHCSPQQPLSPATTLFVL